MIASDMVTGDDIELVNGAVGAFEIIVDGETRYSKLKTRRFPTDAEVDASLSAANP